MFKRIIYMSMENLNASKNSISKMCMRCRFPNNFTIIFVCMSFHIYYLIINFNTKAMTEYKYIVILYKKDADTAT